MNCEYFVWIEIIDRKCLIVFFSTGASFVARISFILLNKYRRLVAVRVKKYTFDLVVISLCHDLYPNPNIVSESFLIYAQIFRTIRIYFGAFSIQMVCIHKSKKARKRGILWHFFYFKLRTSKICNRNRLKYQFFFKERKRSISIFQVPDPLA